MMPTRDGTCTRCGAQTEVWSRGDQDDYDDALCWDCVADDERDADAEERQRLLDSDPDYERYIDDAADHEDRYSNVELREQRESEGDDE